MNLDVLGNIVGHGGDELADFNVIAKIEHEVLKKVGLARHVLIMALQTLNETIAVPARTMIVDETQKVGVRLAHVSLRHVGLPASIEIASDEGECTVGVGSRKGNVRLRTALRSENSVRSEGVEGQVLSPLIVHYF